MAATSRCPLVPIVKRFVHGSLWHHPFPKRSFLILYFFICPLRKSVPDFRVFGLPRTLQLAKKTVEDLFDLFLRKDRERAHAGQLAGNALPFNLVPRFRVMGKITHGCSFFRTAIRASASCLA